MTNTKLARLMGAVGLLAGVAGTAAAQPVPGDPTAPPPTPTEPIATEPVVPTPPPPPAEPPPGHDMAAMHAMHHGHGDDGDGVGKRPEDPTFGFGVGYNMPTSWKDPNVTSARFRLASGLTFEPRVVLATSGYKTDNGVVEIENGATGITLGTNVRIPMASRRKVDLVVVGGGQISFAQDDPDGPDNTTTQTTFDLLWGAGLDYWFSSAWSLSMTATNPVLSYAKVSQEGNPNDTDTSNITIGAVWNPQIDLMIHLFF